MPNQQRLRLRHTGRHHRTGRTDVDWIWRNLSHNLAQAFEMNMWPRHYANDQPPQAYWQMDNYLTGNKTWHDPAKITVDNHA